MTTYKNKEGGTNLYFLKLRQQACTQGAYLNFVVPKQQPHHAVKVPSHLVSEGIHMLVLYVSAIEPQQIAIMLSVGSPLVVLQEAHHWLHYNFLCKQAAIVILQGLQQMHIRSCSKLDIAISLCSEFLLDLSGQAS